MITQPCVVLGSTDRAALFRDELARRGMRFVSFAPSVGRLRRQLVLGEDASLILCVLLSVDDLTPAERQHVARLLADRHSFATRLFCVGIVHESESFTRWAPLGCDAYVSNPRAAMEIINAHVGEDHRTDAVTAQQLLRSAGVAGNDMDTVSARALPPVAAPVNRTDQQLGTSRARPISSAGGTRKGLNGPT